MAIIGASDCPQVTNAVCQTVELVGEKESNELELESQNDSMSAGNSQTHLDTAIARSEHSAEDTKQPIPSMLEVDRYGIEEECHGPDNPYDGPAAIFGLVNDVSPQETARGLTHRAISQALQLDAPKSRSIEPMQQIAWQGSRGTGDGRWPSEYPIP